jgi:hypothetical protein
VIAPTKGDTLDLVGWITMEDHSACIKLMAGDVSKTGPDFDIAGSRHGTGFRSDQQGSVDGSFQINVRNHKQNPADLITREHFYRGFGWKITSSSSKHVKKDSHTAEFPSPSRPMAIKPSSTLYTTGGSPGTAQALAKSPGWAR